MMARDSWSILSNSTFLVATTVATAGLGFGYWWVAAQSFSADDVGLAAAAISMMTLLGYLGMLGFGTLLIAEMPHVSGRVGVYISTALVVSSAAGIVLASVAMVAAPWVSAELEGFASSQGGLMLFPLGVALTSASLVTDHALIGLLRGGTQFVRNAVFAFSKLALLAGAAYVADGGSSLTIFGTWVAGLTISMLLVAFLALRRERRLGRYWPDRSILRNLGPGILGHHTLNMAIQTPTLAMPVIVATVLSAASAGYFYAASMIAGFVSVAAPALGITLYAVASRSPGGYAHLMRLTLGLSFLITGTGCLIVIFAGEAILATFGPEYAAEGTAPLIFLSLATLPGIVKVHYTQVLRIADRIGHAALILSAAAVLELVAATIGLQQEGLVGLSRWFLGALLLEATLMLPSVLVAAALWPRRLHIGRGRLRDMVRRP